MIVLGIILFVIGLGFFYWPNKIVKFLELVEKVLFNKRLILLQNKKIGLVFILVSIILIFSTIKKFAVRNPLYSAYTCFYSKNFTSAEKICLEVINKQPNNVDSWILLGKTYFVTGRYLLSKSVFVKLKTMTNVNKKKKEEIEKYLMLIDKKLGIQK